MLQSQEYTACTVESRHLTRPAPSVALNKKTLLEVSCCFFQLYHQIKLKFEEIKNFKQFDRKFGIEDEFCLDSHGPSIKWSIVVIFTWKRHDNIYFPSNGISKVNISKCISLITSYRKYVKAVQCMTLPSNPCFLSWHIFSLWKLRKNISWVFSLTAVFSNWISRVKFLAKF